MIASPLRLEWYFIKELHVAWQPEFDPGQSAALSVADLSIEFLPRQNQENPLKWAFEVSISLEDNTSKRFPYVFHIALAGFFEMAKVYADKNVSGAEWLAVVNGPAFLYSAAREHIANLTSRGPYPEVILPTVTFLPMDEKSKIGDDRKQPKSSKLVRKNVSKKSRKRAVQKR